MIPFSACANAATGHVLQIAALVLLILALYLCLVTVTRRRLWASVVFGALLAVWTFWFCLLLDGTFLATYMYRVYGTEPRSWPAMVNAVYALPWSVILLSELQFGAVMAFCVRNIRHFEHTHLSEHSVKQMVDLLPVGICIADKRDRALLSNVKMSEICRELTGLPLTGLRPLSEALGEQSEQQGEDRLLPELNGQTLLFSEDVIELDGKTYRQLTATDVSERYRITKELMAKNRRLQDLQLRIKTFGVESNDLLLQQELLHARVTVHDEVGHVLLRGKQFLERPDVDDAKRLYALMRRTNELLLREAESPDEALTDPWQESVNIARAIGVELSCTGTPPEDEALRMLAARALRECAANTVKHSRGLALHVRFDASDGWRMTLANDPPGPEAPVAESGGLLSLRRMAEQQNIRLRVDVEPAFCVTLSR